MLCINYDPCSYVLFQLVVVVKYLLFCQFVSHPALDFFIFVVYSVFNACSTVSDILHYQL